MSTLKELLKDVPVEWQALEHMATFRRGSFPQPYGNSEWYDGEESMPFVQVVDVSEEFRLHHTTKNRISKIAQPKSVFVPNGSVIVTLQGSIGRVAITQYDSYVDRTLAIFENYLINIDKKYFAYQLKHKFNIEKENARGSTIKTITKEEFSKFQIPIPYPNDPKKSLAIQQEIVRVLDGLSEQNKALTTALAQEIDQHKKQYAYYREELFRFEGKEVEWKTLGEVTEKITSGGTPDTKKREYWENGTVPWMSSGEVNLETIYETEKFITVEGLNNSSAKYVPANSIVIALAGQGKTRGMVARTKINLTTNQSLAAIIFDNAKFNTDYVFHYLKTQYKNLREISSGNGARGGLNLQMINKYKMPIPFPNDHKKSLQEQERIVRLLDQFDEATKSIVAQLEKEIELRNKQYEYYRNELLGFSR